MAGLLRAPQAVARSLDGHTAAVPTLAWKSSSRLRGDGTPGLDASCSPQGGYARAIGPAWAAAPPRPPRALDRDRQPPGRAAGCKPYGGSGAPSSSDTSGSGLAALERGQVAPVRATRAAHDPERALLGPVSHPDDVGVGLDAHDVDARRDVERERVRAADRARSLGAVGLVGAASAALSGASMSPPVNASPRSFRPTLHQGHTSSPRPAEALTEGSTIGRT